MNAAKRILHQAGRRGAFLLFLALIDTAYGYGLLVSPAAGASLNLLLPPDVWGVLWLAIGVVCLSGVLKSYDRFQYTCSAVFKTLWALTLTRVWLAQQIPLIWLQAIIWLAFAATVVLISGWHENTLLYIQSPCDPDVTGEK